MKYELEEKLKQKQFIEDLNNLCKKYNCYLTTALGSDSVVAYFEDTKEDVFIDS